MIATRGHDDDAGHRDVPRDSMRTVLTAALILAAMSVLGWFALTATDGGWIHGQALAASIGPPVAAVVLAAAGT